MKQKWVNTDSSQSRIKETTGFDTKFRFIHRIGILYFEDTHSLTTAHTHQPTDQNKTGSEEKA